MFAQADNEQRWFQENAQMQGHVITKYGYCTIRIWPCSCKLSRVNKSHSASFLFNNSV